MRTKYFIYPYGPSNSARDLARALGGKVLRREGSTYRFKQGDILLNWGASNVRVAGEMLNKEGAVRIASSKLASFQVFKDRGVACPEFTRDRTVAQEWSNGGARVLGRDIDRGSGGRGITVYERGTPVGQHMFYTKYLKKRREFRFHVYQGRVIRVLEKLKRNDTEVVNTYVRTHLGGWVFATGHLDRKPYPASLDELAIAAVSALGLDFGGVDIGFHERTGGVVYEVNTAPGLEGSTVPAYAEAIKQTVTVNI